MSLFRKNPSHLLFKYVPIVFILSSVFLAEIFRTDDKNHHKDTKGSTNDLAIAATFIGLIYLITVPILLYVIRDNQRYKKFISILQLIVADTEMIKKMEKVIRTNIQLRPEEKYSLNFQGIPVEVINEARDNIDAIHQAAEQNTAPSPIPFKIIAFSEYQELSRPWRRTVSLGKDANITPSAIQGEATSLGVDLADGRSGPNQMAYNLDSYDLNLCHIIALAKANEIAAHREEPNREAAYDMQKLLVGHQQEEYKHQLDALIEQPKNISIETMIPIYLNAARETLVHDAIQTTVKLGSAAAAWQFSFMLGQFMLNYSSYQAKDLTWKKPIIWVMTGIGAAAGLDLGILLSQLLLHKVRNGEHPQKYLFLCYQLFFSCALADALWQPLTDIGDIYFNFMSNANPALGYMIGIPFYFILYALESFAFKTIHNLLNLFHPGGSQSRFDCNNRFVALLTIAYCSFKLMPTLFAIITGLSLSSLTFVEALVACCVAGIGTAILPALFLWGEEVRKINTLKERVNQLCERTRIIEVDIEGQCPLQNPLLVGVELGEVAEATVKKADNSILTTKYESTYDIMGSPLTYFSPAAVSIIDIIGDCLPRSLYE